MKMFRSNGTEVPAHITAAAAECRGGRMDRREFFALASAFGASTALAYSMLWAGVSLLPQSPRRAAS
jgi:peptide/nickel transport system substrate-binding protein